MTITQDQLQRALGLSSKVSATWIDPLNATLERFQIEEPLHIAAFLAQIGHESALLSAVQENLNYSASGLRAVFPKYFTMAEAEQYARKPQAIANRVYANRMGNGDEASGDGWKFRGRSPVMVTGKDNYEACGAALGIDLIQEPDILVNPEYGAQAAGWFWQSRNLNKLAEAGDFDAITRRINGGMNGAADRNALWKKAKVAMGIG